MKAATPWDAVVDITLPVDKNGRFCPIAGVCINGMLLDGGFELDLILCNGDAPRFACKLFRGSGFRFLPKADAMEDEA